MRDLINRLMVTGGRPTPQELAKLNIDQAMLDEAYQAFTRKAPNILGYKPLIEAVGTPRTSGDQRVLSQFDGRIPVYTLCGEQPLRVNLGEHHHAVREGDALTVRIFMLRHSCEFLAVPSAGAPAFTDDVGSVVANLKALLRPGEHYYEVRAYGMRQQGRRPVDVDSLAVFLMEGLQRVYHASYVEWQQGAGQARTATREIDDVLSRIALPD